MKVQRSIKAEETMEKRQNNIKERKRNVKVGRTKKEK